MCILDCDFVVLGDDEVDGSEEHVAFNLKLIGIGRGEGANDALNRRRYNKYQKHRKDTHIH